MKKILSKTSLLSCALLISNISYAEDGHYIGADVHFTVVEYDYQPSSLSSEDSSDNVVNFGINYGYKYSFENNIFINPEIYYDRLDSTAKDQSSPANENKIKDIEGAKLNIGYNLQDNFGVYASIAHISVDYSIGSNAINDKISDLSYGFGARYYISNKLSARLEYNTANFNLNYGTGDREVADINTTRLGVAYHF
jgi:opacity protein-like surface antigen